MSLMQSLDPTGTLLSWSPSQPYCTYTGLSCDAQGSVVTLSAPGMGLTGMLPSDAAVWSPLSTLTTLNLANNKLQVRLN